MRAGSTTPRLPGSGALLRPLALAFVGVTSCFLSSAAYSQIQQRAIGDLAKTIAGTMMPSIERLNAGRVELRRVDTLARSLGVVDVSARQAVRAEMAAARQAALGELRGYLVLPVSPGEEPLYRAIERALPAIEAAAAPLEAGGDGAPTPAAIASTHLAVEAGAAAIGAATSFNAAGARGAAEQIERLRRRSLVVAVVLNGASVALSLMLALMALRAVRARSALLAERALLLADRAEELEQFAGRVAHDIRNPLSVVSLSLTYLQTTPGAPPEKVASMATRGEVSLRHANQILEGLLEFARAGGRPSPDARADVREVLDAVIEDQRPGALAAGVKLRVEPLPALAAACDPSMLVVVLANLVRNAVKYIGEGPRREVTVRALEREGRVRLEVEDTGPGVAEELREAIFKPFVRGPRRSRQPGIGLGLATVTRICERHGGRVGCEAAPGGGSCFWVELPRAAEGPAGHQRPSDGPGAPAELPA